jgi:hypothetical protein
VLLLRGYQARGVRLLPWERARLHPVCLRNVMLVVDRVVTGPEMDLSIWRSLPVLEGLAVLIYGLVWDAR